MRVTGLGRRTLTPTSRSRQLFSRRKSYRAGPFLIAGTVIVCLALVFTIGFRVGRTFQTESVASAGGIAATVVNTAPVTRSQ